jgi:predicted nuclease of predicted toxin-antitoxin system
VSTFLLDENLSPETGAYLTSVFGFDVTDIITEKLRNITDLEIVAYAKVQRRVIITFDLDFGEIYHLRERGNLGVVILRLEDQTVESVNRALERFFRVDAPSIDLDHSLVVIEEKRVRVNRPASPP